MATMNISLPDPMKTWVEGQVETGRYSHASDYVRDLIRRDQERASQHAHQQKLITEAVEGGLSDLSIDDVTDLARAQRMDHPLG